MSTNGSSNISENQSMSGQEDSQMTLLYSPALSSPLSSTSNEDDEEAEVVEWANNKKISSQEIICVNLIWNQIHLIKKLCLSKKKDKTYFLRIFDDF